MHKIHSDRVLKDLQDWKEAPLDCVVFSLYQLQAFYLNETKRGLAGLGEYTIASKYKSLQLDQLAIQYLPTSSPEDIVKRIKEGKLDRDREGGLDRIEALHEKVKTAVEDDR